jgi:hypothetical protein
MSCRTDREFTQNDVNAFLPKADRTVGNQPRTSRRVLALNSSIEKQEFADS